MCKESGADRNEEVGDTETEKGRKKKNKGAIMSCCTISINHNNKRQCPCVNSSPFHLLHSGECYLTLNMRSAPTARTHTDAFRQHPVYYPPAYRAHINGRTLTMHRLSQCKYRRRHTPTVRRLLSHTVVLINKPNMPEEADRL